MPSATNPRPRAPRSDAAANRDRLLRAATSAVGREGEKVPMATIAAEAGVGVGTLYRHYPTRADLLAALSHRSFGLVLAHARAAAASDSSPLDSIGSFLDRVIEDREQLILPLHNGPVVEDAETVRLRRQVRHALGDILRRGQRDGSIRAGIRPADIVIIGAMLCRPLPHAGDWTPTARRHARIFLTGLAAG